ncbi:MAG: efflux RND transporter periplasmic adaptor subunit [Bacteroidota bacterium]
MLKLMYFFVLLLLLACNNQENNSNQNESSKTETASEDKIFVNTTLVTDSVFQKQILANGTIEASKRSEMRFRQTDNIHQIFVKNGEVVQKGQLLAKLDQTNTRNLLSQAQRELEAAEVRLLEEKANYGIHKKEDSLIAPHIYNVIRNRSGLNEAEARLANKKIMLEQTEIRAPFYGRIANLNTKEGNYITPSDVFCTIVSHQKLDVIFYVLESELPYLSLNQSVKLYPFGKATKKYAGKITEINPLVEENGLVRIKAEIQSPSLDLFDGMNMKVLIEDRIKEVVKIPKEALVLRSNREVVFTYQQGKSKWNYVELIDENTTSYAIQEGVELGDTIIVSNNMNLAHDALVETNFIPPVKDSIQ